MVNNLNSAPLVKRFTCLALISLETVFADTAVTPVGIDAGLVTVTWLGHSYAFVDI